MPAPGALRLNSYLFRLTQSGCLVSAFPPASWAPGGQADAGPGVLLTLTATCARALGAGLGTALHFLPWFPPVSRGAVIRIGFRPESCSAQRQPGLQAPGDRRISNGIVPGMSWGSGKVQKKCDLPATAGARVLEEAWAPGCRAGLPLEAPGPSCLQLPVASFPSLCLCPLRASLWCCISCLSGHSWWWAGPPAQPLTRLHLQRLVCLFVCFFI